MDVVPDTSPVRSRKIGPVNLGVWRAIQRDLQDPRNQVCFYPVVLAESFGSACDVEVAKGYVAQPVGAPGILERVGDPTSVVSFTDLAGLKRMREEGRIVDGMLPKAKAIEDAIRGGVHRVHVISYSAPDSILAEVFTNEGTGTLIVADINALTQAEQSAQK